MFSKKNTFSIWKQSLLMTLIIATHNYVHCTIEYTTCTCKFMSIDVHPMVLKAHQLLNSGSAWRTKWDEDT